MSVFFTVFSFVPLQWTYIILRGRSRPMYLQV